MGKAFIDVGGYQGDSSRAALDPGFAFDKVFCFEPVRACFESIVGALKNPRLEVIHGGLLDKDAQLPIYAPGTLGASIFSDAPEAVTAQAPGELATFYGASNFFRQHIAQSDRVWMKLNCEGAEVLILEDLIRSGEARKLHEVLIDFDAAKIPSARDGVERILALLGKAPFSFHFPEEVQYGMINNYGGIHHWLRATGAVSRHPAALVASARYQARMALDPRCNGYYKIRVLRLLRLAPPPPLHASPFRGRIAHSPK